MRILKSYLTSPLPAGRRVTASRQRLSEGGPIKAQWGADYTDMNLHLLTAVHTELKSWLPETSQSVAALLHGLETPSVCSSSETEGDL